MSAARTLTRSLRRRPPRSAVNRTACAPLWRRCGVGGAAHHARTITAVVGPARRTATGATQQENRHLPDHCGRNCTSVVAPGVRERDSPRCAPHRGDAVTRRRARSRRVVGATGDWRRLDDTARKSAARPPLSEPQEVLPARKQPPRPKPAPKRPLGVPVPRDPRLAESMAAVARFDALLGRFAVVSRASQISHHAEGLLAQAAAELAQVLPGHRGRRGARLAQARRQLLRLRPTQ